MGCGCKKTTVKRNLVQPRTTTVKRTAPSVTVVKR